MGSRWRASRSRTSTSCSSSLTRSATRAAAVAVCAPICNTCSRCGASAVTVLLIGCKTCSPSASSSSRHPTRPLGRGGTGGSTRILSTRCDRPEPHSYYFLILFSFCSYLATVTGVADPQIEIGSHNHGLDAASSHRLRGLTFLQKKEQGGKTDKKGGLTPLCAFKVPTNQPALQPTNPAPVVSLSCGGGAPTHGTSR